MRGGDNHAGSVAKGRDSIDHVLQLSCPVTVDFDRALTVENEHESSVCFINSGTAASYTVITSKGKVIINGQERRSP
jgi:hypothetical protein